MRFTQLKLAAAEAQQQSQRENLFLNSHGHTVARALEAQFKTA